MDPLRRGALMRVGRVLGGAAVGLSGLGRGNVATAGALNTQGSATGWPVKAGSYPEANVPEAPSPLSQARWKAAQPINDQIAELEGWGKPRLENFLGRQSTYLHTLRSTSENWRASVAMDQQKKRTSAVKQLQDQLRNILEGPLEQLDATINDAISSFLVELQKP